MKQFAGLLKREWLEHGGAFTWSPGVVLLVVLLAGLVTLLANQEADVSLTIQERQQLSEYTPPAQARSDTETAGTAEQNGMGDVSDMGAMEILAAMVLDVAGSTDAELKQKMSLLQMGVAQLFHLVFIVIATFALLASLYDERKDASVLFWKSMPVGDVSTVMSKLVFVLWVAPVVTIVAILIAQFLGLALVSVFVEEGMGGRVWAASGFWWQPFALVVGYVQFGLWMLPFAAWVMLVSAAAPKLPALWAFGVPWVLVLLEQIFFSSEVLAEVITHQFKSWSFLRGAGAATADSLNPFGMQLWGGMVIAALFLAGAVYFRRRNNEI